MIVIHLSRTGQIVKWNVEILSPMLDGKLLTKSQLLIFQEFSNVNQTCGVNTVSYMDAVINLSKSFNDLIIQPPDLRNKSLMVCT